MKGSNQNLINANKAKKDEFYTSLTDIEKELPHYKELKTINGIAFNQPVITRKG